MELYPSAGSLKKKGCSAFFSFLLPQFAIAMASISPVERLTQWPSYCPHFEKSALKRFSLVRLAA